MESSHVILYVYHMYTTLHVHVYVMSILALTLHPVGGDVNKCKLQFLGSLSLHAHVHTCMVYIPKLISVTFCTCACTCVHR